MKSLGTLTEISVGAGAPDFAGSVTIFLLKMIWCLSLFVCFLYWDYVREGDMWLQNSAGKERKPFISNAHWNAIRPTFRWRNSLDLQRLMNFKWDAFFNFFVVDTSFSASPHFNNSWKFSASVFNSSLVISLLMYFTVPLLFSENYFIPSYQR